jgi:hypothetical protein
MMPDVNAAELADQKAKRYAAHKVSQQCGYDNMCHLSFPRADLHPSSLSCPQVVYTWA